jgi:hypothetical protein
MEVEPPSFRIVDIEAPAGLQPPLTTSNVSGSARTDPDQPAVQTVQQPGFDFAVPAAPKDKGPNVKPITGKLIFQSAGHASNPDPNTSVSTASVNVTAPKNCNLSDTMVNPNMRKVPTGVKKPTEKITLPPKIGSD